MTVRCAVCLVLTSNDVLCEACVTVVNVAALLNVMAVTDAEAGKRRSTRVPRRTYQPGEYAAMGRTYARAHRERRRQALAQAEANTSTFTSVNVCTNTDTNPKGDAQDAERGCVLDTDRGLDHSLGMVCCQPGSNCVSGTRFCKITLAELAQQHNI